MRVTGRWHPASVARSPHEGEARRDSLLCLHCRLAADLLLEAPSPPPQRPPQGRASTSNRPSGSEDETAPRRVAKVRHAQKLVAAARLPHGICLAPSNLCCQRREHHALRRAAPPPPQFSPPVRDWKPLSAGLCGGADAARGRRCRCSVHTSGRNTRRPTTVPHQRRWRWRLEPEESTAAYAARVSRAKWSLPRCILQPHCESQVAPCPRPSRPPLMHNPAGCSPRTSSWWYSGAHVWR